MESIAGTSSRPSAVSAYSTDGGEVGFTSRVTTPFFSRLRRRIVRTLAEIPGTSTFSSPNRREPALRYQMMLGVHAPPRMLMHSVRGHVTGGGADLFF
jgi:hypothetical protein